jgi:hypothetical protein
MSLQFGTSTALGVGTALNSLASSTTTFAQTDALALSTSVNLTDVMVQFDIAIGSISASASTVINFFAAGSEDGSTYSGGASSTEVIGATAGAVTVNTNGNNLRWLGSMQVHTTGITMRSQPMSLAAAFNGMLPRKVAFVIQNQTGAALAASGHSCSYSEVSYT